MAHINETWLAGMAKKVRITSNAEHFGIEVGNLHIGTLRGQHSVDLEEFLAEALDKVRKFNSTVPSDHETLAVEIAADEIGIDASELGRAIAYVRSQQTSPWTADELEALR